MTFPRILCLGEILIDLLADELGDRPVEGYSWTAYPGGAPANVASALVKLGTSAGFMGCVGQDEPGDALVALLQDIGVDDMGIQRHTTAPTRQVYITRSEAGDRQFAGFGDRDPAEFADAYLQADSLPVELFEAAEFLVLGTLALAYADSRDAIARALDLAEQHNLKVVVDINWRHTFWPDVTAARPLIQDLLQRIDFLKLSEEEALWFFETTEPSQIVARLDSLEGAIVTAGERGCAYCLNDLEGRLPAFPVAVEDTTGAGDSFLAGFLHQLCQQGIATLTDPERTRSMVRYATAVGSLTTTRPGAIAAQPTAAEIEAFLYLNAVRDQRLAVSD